jgi:hypothetical protein
MGHDIGCACIALVSNCWRGWSALVLGSPSWRLRALPLLTNTPVSLPSSSVSCIVQHWRPAILSSPVFNGIGYQSPAWPCGPAATDGSCPHMCHRTGGRNTFGKPYHSSLSTDKNDATHACVHMPYIYPLEFGTIAHPWKSGAGTWLFILCSHAPPRELP